MSRSVLILVFVSAAWVSVFAGCKSDPYCQTAIANLRAEKIQMENQYYELKARYESDVVNLGQPTSTFSQSLTHGFIEGDIIYNGVVSSNTGGYSRAVVSESYTPTTNSSPDVAMSIYIQSVEVNQLAARTNETTRLLIRPLDDQGAIMPVSGGLKIRLYEPGSGNTLFDSEFSASQVSQWVNDRPGGQAGIHVPIPLGNRPTLSDRLICDVQFRTADNRILKQSTELVFAGSAGMSTAAPNRTPAQNASQPMLPEGLDESVNIEFGDELNFDSIDQSGSDPQWGPDR